MAQTQSFFSILSKNEKSLCEKILNGQEELYEQDDLFNKLYDHFQETGHMPYSVQKARDTDPYTWIFEQIDKEFNKFH